jgi:hypothetical protein
MLFSCWSDFMADVQDYPGGKLQISDEMIDAIRGDLNRIQNWRYCNKIVIAIVERQNGLEAVETFCLIELMGPEARLNADAGILRRDGKTRKAPGSVDRPYRR